MPVCSLLPILMSFVYVCVSVCMCVCASVCVVNITSCSCCNAPPSALCPCAATRKKPQSTDKCS